MAVIDKVPSSSKIKLPFPSMWNSVVFLC
jgi:hypothetical protein